MLGLVLWYIHGASVETPSVQLLTLGVETCSKVDPLKKRNASHRK